MKNIDYWLNNEQRMIRKAVREFSEKEIAPVARESSEKEKFPAQIVNKMSEVGLLGIFVQEEYEGGGMDYLSYCLAVEEISRVDCAHGAIVAAINSYGIGPIFYFGSDAQKEEWLPKLCTGELLASFGFALYKNVKKTDKFEPYAIKDGKYWLINGSRKMVFNASTDLTGLCIVQVMFEKENKEREVSCFLVPKETTGVVTEAIENKLAWRAADIGKMLFENCRVPEKNLLGKPGEGEQQVEMTLDLGRLAFAAVALGGAQGAYDRAVSYAKKRMLYGKPLASFQVNSAKLARMAIKIEAGRNLLYKSCKLKDSGEPFRKEAIMAKCFCTEAMGQICDDTVQLHGAIGLLNEFDVERMYRDYKGYILERESLDEQYDLISNELGLG